jgi:CheY-like chemotaxis protein
MKIPERIIVVDDDSINNMFCKYIIKEALSDKVEIIMFTSPKKAVDYVNLEYHKDPVTALMFLDINMPGLSGWDVLDEFERSEVNIAQFISIFILSSSVDPKDKDRARSSRLVKGFLEKPLEAKTVREICGIS